MALYKYVKEEPKAKREPFWSQIRVNLSISLPQISLPTLSFPDISPLPSLSSLIPTKRPQLAYAPSVQTDSPVRTKRGKAVRLTSLAIGLSGILLISWVTYPIISFEIKSRTKFAKTVQPVPPSEEVLGWEQVQKINDQATGVAVARADTSSPAPQVQSSSTDYNSINNWLPSRQQRGVQTAGRIYYLSIPRLKIQDALVKIAGEDLDSSLIHYGGTGLPGEYGTSVIFGHSILPQFYDPSNYKAIFSLLPELEEGDEITLKYDGISYRYVIFSMRVTSPDDISVLEQRYDAPYLTLVTCVPPGTYWKRLEVKARLVPA